MAMLLEGEWSYLVGLIVGDVVLGLEFLVNKHCTMLWFSLSFDE